MNKLPELTPPIECHELHERFFMIRPLVLEGLEQEYYDFVKAVSPEKDQYLEQFRSEPDLRETLTEVILAAFLWIEAGRPSHEIVQNCLPEIKHLLVYAMNMFLRWLEVRCAIQPETNLSRGSLADAWIYLLVEFRSDLKIYPFWWDKSEPPFACY